ncbi:DNA cytosine methyltransferase [Hydrogenophaga laconesensis]|uniref:DNA (Cytosine-5)-methyltransferase 1 n=1 Tax=Hydrogenophaga laconesensis TaxID=1805971 RepID=A0ABU1V492_9BURK|nr:DNA cytosine methyltransferase [Hydrogenophaga laconesensis]MDR7092289.1 DNA (cytosine-5)-methyltransferase 1 [Hydrogenophaga laconesensis]
MNELALFAGAGGGILGGHLLGWRTVCAVEFNAHSAGILVQRQNDGVLHTFPIWDDVRTFDGIPWRGRIDVVSGGFPCQAYSSAARGKNTADDLWPEMRRIVADVAPRYVFAENVSKRAINRAADELEEMGFATRCVPLSASDVGGDHVRERYWLLAYTDVHSELHSPKHAEVAQRQSLYPGIWEAYPDEPRMADGMADRMDRLQATGNGQVPAVAAAAWRLLAPIHSLEGNQHE